MPDTRKIQNEFFGDRVSRIGNQLNMKTIHEILTNGVKKLEEASVDTPRLDAEVLLAHVLRIQRVDLILKRDKAITDEQHARFDELIGERVRRRPVSQLIGLREFWSIPITVNEHVLTPRPETEGIIEFALKCFPREQELRILDLGTGSGCIAAALAVEFPRAHITATDISEEALSVARNNLTFAADRTILLDGDLFDAFGHRVSGIWHQMFDLIVANPPYVDRNECTCLPPEVRDFEPMTALVADERGLAILRKIAQYAPRYINSGGWLILEVGKDQAPAVRDMLSETNAFDTITVHKDLAGIERIVAAQRA